jgi:hypothetical protein
VTVAGHAASNGGPQFAAGLAQTLHRYFDGVHDAAGMTICQHALDAARQWGDLTVQRSPVAGGPGREHRP